MFYDIIIIGGGASGLCTAIWSKTENNSVLILDHNAMYHHPEDSWLILLFLL